ncbi:MAG: hypothetical protein NTX82_04125 [Candidatus Parcubacteria bacterium]|nr:hypothetical protein [Candidatus Parcubacteria bacterium]
MNGDIFSVNPVFVGATVISTIFGLFFLAASAFESSCRNELRLNLKRKWGMLLDENGTLINEEKLRVYEAWQQKAILFSLFLGLTCLVCNCVILTYAGQIYYLTLLAGILSVIFLSLAVSYGRKMEFCRKSGCERYPDMDGEEAPEK